MIGLSDFLLLSQCPLTANFELITANLLLPAASAVDPSISSGLQNNQYPLIRTENPSAFVNNLSYACSDCFEPPQRPSIVVFKLDQRETSPKGNQERMREEKLTSQAQKCFTRSQECNPMAGVSWGLQHLRC